jgi:hypothetical protein
MPHAWTPMVVADWPVLACFFLRQGWFLLIQNSYNQAPDRVPLKENKLYIRPLQEHPVPFAVADHRCRKLDLLHLPQWRRSRMKLPADSRFDKESSNLKPISSTQCCSNIERLGQIPFSPKTDASRNTGMLRPISSNPAKGIQGHLPYRWKLNLQGRDTNPVNTSPVKAPSLLRTTAKR